MKLLCPNERVRVKTIGGLIGETGTVVRLRKSDHGAWVKMDKPLPLDLASYRDDRDPRRDHVLLYPADCEAVR
jgi:hypothetical protein